MRLSQLLKYKLDLQKQNSEKIEQDINDHIGHVNQLAMNSERMLEAEFFQNLNAKYRNLFPLIQDIEQTKKAKIAELDKKISDWDKQYFIDSYNMYETQHKIADVATNRDIRRLYTYGNVKEIIQSRIYRYVNWQYPSLEIGPGDGEYTEQMIAGDPLYIVDVHQEFLDATKNRFNEFYATRRLRSYLVKNDYDLSMLPQKQMGFVLAWNVFNYFPLEAIKSYLVEIKKTMRPGGILMFSYNNSDRWQGAEMVENAFMCHTPKHMLLPLVESLGFNVLDSKDYDPTVSWVELEVEGKLQTNKAHQVLGSVIQIVDRDEDPKSVEARAQQELKNTLDAQQRYELQKNRPDLLEQAKEYRAKYNLTLEKAIERIITDEGIEPPETLTHDEPERKLTQEQKRRAFDVSELAKSLQLKYHTYTKEHCIKKALEKYGYTDLTIDDINY